MPHIAREDKPPYGPAIAQLKTLLRGKPKGHLTYVLYMLTLNYPTERRYAALSDARACLGDAYDEFYRLIMAPYEEEVIAKNGPAHEV